MKDSTIFKLAAGAGILAFVARLVLVQPEDLGVQRGLLAQHRGDEIGRLAAAGDYESALRIATRRQSERYLDQNGWSRIASLLEGQARHEGRDFDAAAALEAFHAIAPSPWVDESGAMGWAAYFLGFSTEDDAQARAAWRLGADAFERLVRDRPDNAGAWDWLYRARTWMRLGDVDRTRQALLDTAPWAQTPATADADEQPIDELVSFLRTYGRTWAFIGGVDEAESLWRRADELHAAETMPVQIAESWRIYASEMYRAGERAAGDLAIEMCIASLERVIADDPHTAMQCSSMWQEMARRFSRRDLPDRAAEALDRAILHHRAALTEGEGAQDWYDFARMLARRGDTEEALVALERSLDAGYLNADRLAGEDEFEAIRTDPRYQSLVTRAYEMLEAMYPGSGGQPEPRRLHSGDGR